MLIDDEELALPDCEFPWFKAATIQPILNALRADPDRLDWPDLDKVRTVHNRDLINGWGAVQLSYALARKYRNAATE
jgi:hypothetical protein